MSEITNQRNFERKLRKLDATVSGITYGKRTKNNKGDFTLDEIFVHSAAGCLLVMASNAQDGQSIYDVALKMQEEHQQQYKKPLVSQ